MSNIETTRVGNHNRFRIQLSEDVSANRASIDKMLADAKGQFGADRALDRFEFRLKTTSEGVKYLELRNQSKFGQFREWVGGKLGRSADRATERKEAVVVLAKAYPHLMKKMPDLIDGNNPTGGVNDASIKTLTRDEAHTVRDVVLNPIKIFVDSKKSVDDAKDLIFHDWKRSRPDTFEGFIGGAALSYPDGSIKIVQGKGNSNLPDDESAELSKVTAEKMGLREGTDEFDNVLSNLFRFAKKDMNIALNTLIGRVALGSPAFNPTSETSTKIYFDKDHVRIERQISCENFSIGNTHDKSYSASIDQKFSIPISELKKDSNKFDPLCIERVEFAEKLTKIQLD